MNLDEAFLDENPNEKNTQDVDNQHSEQKSDEVAFNLEQELQRITEKVRMLIALKNIQPSRFADIIGVQRSGVSHLLSGRNKAGIELIMRILKYFPDVNLYWLLGDDNVILKNDLIADENIFEEGMTNAYNHLNGEESNESSYKTKKNSQLEKEKRKNNKEKEIQKVMVFYTDGTFDAFKSMLEK